MAALEDEDEDGEGAEPDDDPKILPEPDVEGPSETWRKKNNQVLTESEHN